MVCLAIQNGVKAIIIQTITVKDHKVILHDLRGNKTLNAVTQSTAVSYRQHIIGDRIDEQSNFSKDSTAHTYGDCKDVKEIVNCL